VVSRPSTRNSTRPPRPASPPASVASGAAVGPPPSSAVVRGECRSVLPHNGPDMSV